MSRPKSDAKRQALLLAAADAIAQRGISAPTAQISRMAGVAEGTLFKYFPTKEILFNELYLYLYERMCEATGKTLATDEPLLDRARNLWNSHIEWALQYPAWHRTLNQLAVTDILTEDTRRRELALFPDIGLAEAYTRNPLFKGLDPAFMDSMLIAIADTTLSFVTRDNGRAEQYKQSGLTTFLRIFFPES